jgi:flagellar biosynthesis protein FliR
MLLAAFPEHIYAFFAVFARLGAAFMLMPGFGESFIYLRGRLAMALMISVVATPIAAPALPALPSGPLDMTMVIASEVTVGLLIGGLARLMMSALHTASMLIAYQSGLAAATIFDPSQNTQGAMIGRFFSLVVLVLLFATELHHDLLLAVVESYRLLPPGGLPPVGDFAAQAISFMSSAFVVALQISAPVMVVGLLFYLGLGLVARLMPAVQVFFVALPLQIFLGFWVTLMALSAMLLWYFEYFEAGIARLLIGG